MGAGLLTSLVIAKDGIHNECAKTTEPVRVSVANVPLLTATHGNLVELFGKKDRQKESDAFLSGDASTEWIHPE
jgi:hypothetical protein